MFEAAFWGFIGGFALLLGAAVGFWLNIAPKKIALVMGFGAGALISAVSFELTEEAFKSGGAGAVTIGLTLGALAFFSGDLLIDRAGGDKRKSCRAEEAEGPAGAIALGAVLDGVPESAVIGISLTGPKGVSAAVVAAVFMSNMPESLASASGMKRSGHSSARVLLMWSAVVAICALSAVLGYELIGAMSPKPAAIVQAFAAGAILTMLADTMMPESFKEGGNVVGLVTVLGFATAFLVSTLEG